MDFPASRTPAPVAVGLGYLALAPFVAGAALVLIGETAWRPTVVAALAAYAAVVIAFIGAIDWGFAFTTPQSSATRWVWGVTPALVAWAAQSAAPRTCLAIQALTLLVCYLVDRATYPSAGAAATCRCACD